MLGIIASNRFPKMLQKTSGNGIGEIVWLIMSLRATKWRSNLLARLVIASIKSLVLAWLTVRRTEVLPQFVEVGSLISPKGFHVLSKRLREAPCGLALR
ncbi:MAG: hypothetical protein IT314_10395 [Anaerolineales bacterium]|nr:hypothetical protein [Anaerolineales bacterium]